MFRAAQQASALQDGHQAPPVVQAMIASVEGEMFGFSRDPLVLPSAEDALPGRHNGIEVAATHSDRRADGTTLA